MKYDRKKLIETAQKKITALKNEASRAEQEMTSNWKGYRAGLIADAQIYLRQLKEWPADPKITVPRLNNRYMPSTGYGGARQEVAQLEQFIKHMELTSAAEVEFKNSYDVALLNIICK